MGRPALVRLSLEPIQTHQIPELIKLARRIWIQAFSPLFTKEEFEALFEGLNDPIALRRDIESAAKDFFFIVSNDIVIGYTAWKKEGAVLWIDKLYVEQHSQSKGAGSWALQAAEAYARKMDICELQLRVNQNNRAAITFYLNQRFKVLRKANFSAPSGYLYKDFIMCKSIE